MNWTECAGGNFILVSLHKEYHLPNDESQTEAILKYRKSQNVCVQIRLSTMNLICLKIQHFVEDICNLCLTSFCSHSHKITAIFKERT